MWRTPSATAWRTNSTCSDAVVRRLVPRPTRGTSTPASLKVLITTRLGLDRTSTRTLNHPQGGLTLKDEFGVPPPPVAARRCEVLEETCDIQPLGRTAGHDRRVAAPRPVLRMATAGRYDGVH